MGRSRLLGFNGYWFADHQQELAREVDAGLQRVQTLVQRRIAERLPLAYLLDAAGSWAEFEIRAWCGSEILHWLFTGGLARWFASPRAAGSGRRAAGCDVCSGCGCLGIIAAHNFADAQVTLIELDPKAAALARRNVSKCIAGPGHSGRGRCT